MKNSGDIYDCRHGSPGTLRPLSELFLPYDIGLPYVRARIYYFPLKTIIFAVFNKIFIYFNQTGTIRVQIMENFMYMGSDFGGTINEVKSTEC